MNMFLSVILLIVGFILLIKGADFFVDGAANTAQNFKVSKMLIGLTIIAFGTSAPEFAVSIQALASGSTDMVLGNVIGSNILNVLLILGLSAVIHPLKIRSNTIRKEIPICLLVSTLLVTLFLDVQLASGTIDQLSRSDALAILLFFAVFLYYLINMARSSKDRRQVERPKFGLGKSLLLVGVGLVGIIFGSDLVVSSATDIAGAIGISQRVISLTVIALGTSLPELVTSITAARKGETDLLLGNIIGSNIFNICIVLGVPVAIFGTITPASFQIIDMIMLIASAIILFIFSATKHCISRAEGVAMLAIFAVYFGCLFVV